MKRLIATTALICAVAAPASADGLGGLAAAPILLAFVAVVFIVPAAMVAAAMYLIRHSKNPDRKFWLTDTDIPRGLRAMALVQYLLAVLYGLTAVYLRSFPEMHNGKPAEWVIHRTFFDTALAVALAVTATGIINRSHQMGYQWGRLVGWACVIDAIVYSLWHGPYGMSLLSPLFGLVLLATLKWGHQDYWRSALSRS